MLYKAINLSTVSGTRKSQFTGSVLNTSDSDSDSDSTWRPFGRLSANNRRQKKNVANSNFQIWCQRCRLVGDMTPNSWGHISEMSPYYLQHSSICLGIFTNDKNIDHVEDPDADFLHDLVRRQIRGQNSAVYRHL